MAKLNHFLAKALMPLVALCLVFFCAFSPVSASFSYKPIVADVPFTCVRAEVGEDETYEFVIEKLDESSPVPEKNEISITGSGNGSFSVKIDEPGTYRYKVFEKTGKNSDIVYDETVYIVTLFVTNNDKGDLEYQVILSKDDMVKPTEVKFVNQAARKPDKPDKPDTPPVVKTGDLSQTWQGAGWAFLIMGAFLLLLALYNLCLTGRRSDSGHSGNYRGQTGSRSYRGLTGRHAKNFRRMIGVILVMANLVSSTGMVLAKESSDETETEDTTITETEEPSEETTEGTTEETTESEDLTEGTTEGTTEGPTDASTESTTDTTTESTIDTSTENTSEESSSEETDPSAPVPTVKVFDAADYSVTVSYGAETGIPEDAELVVREVMSEAEYDEYYQQLTDLMDESDVGYARFFDISLVKDNVECEPASGTSVSVTITIQEQLQEEVSVVHLPDEDEVAVVENDTISTDEGTEVSFEAEGFSAYAIVTGPQPEAVGWFRIRSVADLKAWAQKNPAEGLYICHPNGYYFKNSSGNAETGRTGIKKTKPARSAPNETTDAAFYFELVPGTEDQFYVYCYADNGTTKQYVYNGGNNSLSFTTDASQKTAFTASCDANGVFSMRNGDWYWNMKGGNGGDYFCSYNTAGDTNNRLYFQYHEDISSDPYALDGQSYGLLYYVTGLKGKAMMATSSNGNSLEAQVMTVMQKSSGSSDRLFVPQNEDLPIWTFTWVSDDLYYISAQVDGAEKYLNVTASGVTMVDPSDRQALQVVPGSGNDAGKIRILSTDGHTVGYSGSTSEGFVHDGTGSMLNLVNKTELNQEYEQVYTAQKKSVSEVTSGQKVIVYTRVWNDDKKDYDFFAIDKDGTLVSCIEDGDVIGWIGKTENTLLWEFTDYSEGQAIPNHFYELYNEASGKYIAPQLDGQILSDEAIGIHLAGRETSDYGTTIKAWDESGFAYAQLAANSEGTRVISRLTSDEDRINLDEKEEFFFAVIDDVFDDEVLESVPTIDNDVYGIKMAMVDFKGTTVTVNNTTSTKIQNDILGHTKWDAAHAYEPTQGILETNLQEDGYPRIADDPTKSLAALFNGTNANAPRREVNHLFLESTYNSSGYFVYESSQNYAYLQDNNDFIIYQELGSYDSGGNKNTLKHGQFLPYNDLKKDEFCTTNSQNLYSITGQVLPEADPRKYERLHAIDGAVNLYFGMELETSFVQTPSGHDDWGHDIIYQFTGDDDFWLYVDGELVLDLGGIHSAISGSVNFSTGEVVVANQPPTSLREVFRSNYETRGYSESEIEAMLEDKFDYNPDTGTYTFKDYTFHTMKVFYMERGGGASNLRMKFNQSSVKPETVLFGKEIEGTQTVSSANAQFPFQIYYATDENTPIEEYELLDPDELNINVTYRGTGDRVPFSSRYYPNQDEYPDEYYDNVFLLRAGDLCELSMPDGTIMYYVKECAVDPQIYSKVKVNGKDAEPDVVVTANPVTGLKDYTIPKMPVKQRTRVTFTNVVNEDATQTLSFTKWLYDEHQVRLLVDDETTFNFRLYLDLKDEETELTYESMQRHLAYMQKYSIRDRNGVYCRWDTAAQKFVPIDSNKTDYSTLTAEEKTQCTFRTSANGGISKVPAFYTIEVHGLMPGTKYMIEERDKDMPDGYGRVAYLFDEDHTPSYPLLPDGEDTVKDWTGRTNAKAVMGQTESGKDPYVDIKNVKGYGIRANKIWADDDYMAERAPTYFAVFTGEGDDPSAYVLAKDTIHQLKFGEETTYWFFETLPNDQTDLSTCHVYEVTLSETDPEVDEDTGVVTYHEGMTVTIIEDHEVLHIEGKLLGDTSSETGDYTVCYDEGIPTSDDRIRTDTITNDRYGIEIYKYMWNGQDPLEGVEFELRDTTDSSNVIGPFTSDETGHVTTAFLRRGVPYELVETKTPEGYIGTATPITVTLGNDGKTLTVTGPDGWFTYTDGTDTNEPQINVKNKTYQMQVVKTDDQGNPLDETYFSLHRWKVVGGVGYPETAPIEGYESLVSDENGIVRMPDGNTLATWYTLPAGSYALVEEQAKDGYQSLPYSIRFTVLETGGIRIDGVYAADEVTLNTSDENGRVRESLTVVNRAMETLTITKKVEGNFGNKAQKFTFTVALYDEYNQPIKGKKYVKYSYENRERQITFNSNGVATISLAHGESIEIRGLKQGTRYVITETTAQGYSVKYCEGQANYDAGTFVSGNSLQGRVGVGTHVYFVNTRKGIIPTGVDFSVRAILGAALISLIGTGAYIYMGKRRKKEEELENE